MSILDILQWVVTVIMGGFMAWIAFKKMQPERNNMNGSASKAYAEAAKLAAESAKEYASQVNTLEARLELLERKAYRITIDFTIGEPPTVGVVKIEPMIVPPHKE